MASLFETKYPNNSREVSGTVTLYRDDVILLCDTSSAPVVIDLLDIPENRWNTTYKLYVFDMAGNASTNNITINAGGSQQINNQASLVLNQNNSGALIRVASNTAYLGSLTFVAGDGGGYETVEDEGTPLPQQTVLNFIGEYVAATDGGTKTDITINPTIKEVLNADLLALIAAETLVVGLNYKVTDPTYAETVTVLAIRPNQTSLGGTATWLCADWQIGGDYSGVAGFNAQLGIWNSNLTPVAGDVVIYNNLHWVSNGGTNTSPPPLDGDVWTLLPKTDTNGYIRENYVIKYLPNSNLCTLVSDARNNIIEYNTPKGVPSTERFPFGRSGIRNNSFLGQESSIDYWNFRNLTMNNNVINDSLLDISTIDPDSTSDTINIDSNVLFNGGQLGIGGIITGSVAFVNNEIHNGNAEFYALTLAYTGNVDISSNMIHGGQIFCGHNAGLISGTFDIFMRNNSLQGLSARLYFVDVTANNSDVLIENNIVTEAAEMELSISSANFSGNQIDLEGTFTWTATLDDNVKQGGIGSVLTKEKSTFRKELDFNDVGTYISAALSLDLGTENWIGEYYCINTAAKNVDFILNGQKIFPFTLFAADAGGAALQVGYTAMAIATSGGADHIIDNSGLVSQTRFTPYGEYKDSLTLIRREIDTAIGTADNNILLSTQIAL